MKKLSSLKLNQLSQAELEKREMQNIHGGSSGCQCGCSGPSSIYDNMKFNADSGYTETKGEPQACGCHEDEFPTETSGVGDYF
jgi:natural product precursor